MRGSAVVQGLKSWVSALHPQLPLTPKESQRLLTALTTSFRRQLDDNHPHHGQNDGKPQTIATGNTSTAFDRSYGLHSSSAASADKHLASVLTNPLMAQGEHAERRLELVTAELRQNPTKDPIELFEGYRKKGHATVPIAIACLEAYRESLKRLPIAAQKARIAEAKAGKRVLQWVLDTKVFREEMFNRDHRLADLMVQLVVHEGLEIFLWDWLQLEAHAAGRARSARRQLPGKADMEPYRWKARVIRNIVAAKTNGAPSFDAALEALFKSLELNDADYIPLIPSIVVLMGNFRRDPGRTNATDVVLYDRFIALLRSKRFAADDKSQGECDACWLSLCHPRSPSPLPALTLLREKLRHQADGRVRRPGIAKGPTYQFLLARTQAQLEDLGREADAAWVAGVAAKTVSTAADTDGSGRTWTQRVQAERALYNIAKQAPASKAAASEAVGEGDDPFPAAFAV